MLPDAKGCSSKCSNTWSSGMPNARSIARLEAEYEWAGALVQSSDSSLQQGAAAVTITMQQAAAPMCIGIHKAGGQQGPLGPRGARQLLKAIAVGV